MNCEIRQTHKGCGQSRPGMTPLARPVCSCTTASATMLTSIFYPGLVARVMWVAPLGTIETHHPALGPGQVLKCFNDIQYTSIKLAMKLYCTTCSPCTTCSKSSYRNLPTRVYYLLNGMYSTSTDEAWQLESCVD